VLYSLPAAGALVDFGESLKCRVGASWVILSIVVERVLSVRIVVERVRLGVVSERVDHTGRGREIYGHNVVERVRWRLVYGVGVRECVGG
jgi:hypothetical protein